MSHVNVTGVVKNHGVQSNIFAPLVEAVVNSIDAIEDRGVPNGKIKVLFKRDKQTSLLNDSNRSRPDIIGMEVIDNGIGFNQENRDSFDTFYSPRKQLRGGKGFGRFMYKKYFDDISVESIFEDDGKFKKRTFVFGSDDEIIAKDSEKLEDIENEDIQTIVSLSGIKNRSYPKELETIAKNLLEKILVYFITDGYIVPTITLEDEDGKRIILNDLVKNSKEILSVDNVSFELTNNKTRDEFTLKMFKIFSPGNQSSKIVLTADKREVVNTSLHEYIPEFRDEFFEQDKDNGSRNNFIIKGYVLGKYLDKNVTVERDNFLFEKDKDLFYSFSRNEIERRAVELIEKRFAADLNSRKEKKYGKVNEFLKSHPWYKELKEEINWNEIPMNPTDEDIDLVVHKIGYKKEKNAKLQINKALADFDKNIPEKIEEIFSAIDVIKKGELAHYISLRKVFLDVLKKALDIDDEDKKHEKEELLHGIIFPTKKDSDSVSFGEHNLWILDERLNFVEYLRSDMILSKSDKSRPDIVAFDQKVAFRGGDEPSNPITIFEFKRPGRDDFADKSSKEDPYEQVVDYVESIRDGKLKTPENRPIQIGENTPFFGYIVADKTQKVEKWLVRNDFSALPDGQRWFKWQIKYNLYIEFITWDQLLKDADLRNKVFFKKLGI